MPYRSKYEEKSSSKEKKINFTVVDVILWETTLHGLGIFFLK
jgi:hypothetical protein